MNYESFTKKAPGVYVVEEPSASQPITGASISNAGFVGIAEDIVYPAGDAAGRGGQQLEFYVPGKAVQILSWGQYQSTFGGFLYGRYLAYAVFNYFQQGGSVCYISRAVPNESTADTNWGKDSIAAYTARLSDVIAGYDIQATSTGSWGNNIYIEIEAFPKLPGGSQKPPKSVAMNVYFVPQNPAAKAPTPLPADDSKAQYLVDTYFGLPATFKNDPNDGGLKKLQAAISNINQTSPFIRIRAGKPVDAGEIKIGDAKALKQEQAGNLAYDFIGLPDSGVGLDAFEKQKDARVLAIPDLASPDLHAVEGSDPTLPVAETLSKVHAFINEQKDRFYVVDPPNGLSVNGEKNILDFRGELEASSYWSIYYPWLKIANPIGDGLIEVPPSGSVAGLIAAADGDVGPWQSPAGITHGQVNAFDLSTHVTEAQQGVLNQWPANINAIRKFPDVGSVVWGARTLSSDIETKYVAVRRLLLYVELSIQQSLDWAVFLPNNTSLWALLRRDVDIFLTGLWRQGALFGDAKNQAFQIVCDHTNNTTETIDQGLLIMQVAVAPVRPAEFIVITVSQNMQTGGG